MAGVNKVILLGKLGSDPETSTLPSGIKVSKFNIATSENYTDSQGVKVENTEWHKIEMWDKLANIAEQYLKKGDSVYVEGKIRTEKYTDKDNIQRTVTKIRGTAISLIGGSKQGSTEQSQSRYQVNTPPSPPAPSDSDQDLPF